MGRAAQWFWETKKAGFYERHRSRWPRLPDEHKKQMRWWPQSDDREGRLLECHSGRRPKVPDAHGSRMDHDY